MHFKAILSVTLVLCGLASTGTAANIYGLKPGQLELKSASVLAFGPDGILFIGDPIAAEIIAVESGDKPAEERQSGLNIEGINRKIAEELGVAVAEVQIHDLAVNPETGNLFLAVTAGQAVPVVLKIDGAGALSVLDFKQIPFAKASLPNPAEDKEVGEGRRRRNNRPNAITDLAFVEGMVIASGLSDSEAASNVWSLTFPFSKVNNGTNLEFYHGAHGRRENYAAVRTFVPLIVDGEPQVLAGFVCTPLVKFPLSQLTAAPQETVQGTTVAELGNRNQPLDMIAYVKDGKDFLLLANSARGVMKISTENLGRDDGITSHVPDGGVAGQDFETIEELAGTVQLDRLNDEHAVVIIQDANGVQTLKTVLLP